MFFLSLSPSFRIYVGIRAFDPVHSSQFTVQTFSNFNFITDDIPRWPRSKLWEEIQDPLFSLPLHFRNDTGIPPVVENELMLEVKLLLHFLGNI